MSLSIRLYTDMGNRWTARPSDTSNCMNSRDPDHLGNGLQQRSNQRIISTYIFLGLRYKQGKVWEM